MYFTYLSSTIKANLYCRMKCDEAPDEPAQEGVEGFDKLDCHISVCTLYHRYLSLALTFGI
jgi:hypothetical protein